MIAERVIRPFTVNGKNFLFYSSEQGVDVAVTYLTVIESAKMHGLEVRDYLVRVFRGKRPISTSFLFWLVVVALHSH